MKKPCICLNMIVKNEAPVIERCLASTRGLIDQWCIVDTGSTDGTQHIIRNALREVPGQLHERPWKNFGHNRSEALTLAQQQCPDYLLFIDADEWFDVPQGFTWPDLTADAYELTCHYAGVAYARCALVAARLPWRWEGVLHEFLSCPEATAPLLLAAPHIIVHHDGARARDPDTYLRDIQVLEEALRQDPDNTRNRFYLAQSYRDAGHLKQARDAYELRAAMGGWDEEVWYSMFQVALLNERLESPHHEVVDSYLRAFEYRPTRGEPLVELARYHRLRGDYAQACLYAQVASQMPMPPDRLFVDTATCGWRALDELSISAFYARSAHFRDSGARASVALTRMLDRVPPQEHARIERNAGFYGVATG